MSDSRKPLQLAGGVEAVAIKVGLSYSAVDKWPHNGYPDRHWDTLIEMAAANEETLTPDQLFQLNREIRKRKQKEAA